MEVPEIPLTSKDAVRTAALLGEAFSLQVLVAAGVDVRELDPLFDNRVLESDTPSQATFVDPGFHQELLQKIPWSFRRKWSLKLGESLEKLKGAPGKLGELFLAAQEYDRARPHLIRAGEIACLANEYGKALGFLRQVFEIWPADKDSSNRLRLLRELARCAANTGDYETAIIAWEELLDNARTQDDIPGQIEAHQQLAEWAGKQGSRSLVRDRLKAAAELATLSGDYDMEARHWFEYGGFLMIHVRLQAANAAFEKAYQATFKGGDIALRIEVMATRALGQAMVGKSDLAFTWIDEALNLAIARELPEQVTYVYRRMANVNEYCGNFQAYLDLELKALDRCQASKRQGLEQACLSCLSYAFFRCGQWKRSQEMLRLVLDELDLQGELGMVAVGTRAVIAAFRGERRLAEASRESFDSLVRVFGGAYMQFHIHWVFGFQAWLEDDGLTARREFDDLLDHWYETEDRHDAVPGLLTACAYFSDANQQARVAQCIDILNTIYSDNKNIENRSAREAAMAEDAWMRGNVKAAVKLACSAIAGYETQKMPIEVALISRRLGKMHLSSENEKWAEDAFFKVESIAKKLGMRPLLDAIQADGKMGLISGGTVNPATPGLTKRQKEVLRHMADGLTNKEVASRLSLSPRTVEMHVGSILDRLNCRARTEAIKKAVESGLI